eukprot:scaffold246602_cov31-Tisochrysis_lutea.AAC.3
MAGRTPLKVQDARTRMGSARDSAVALAIRVRTTRAISYPDSPQSKAVSRRRQVFHQSLLPAASPMGNKLLLGILGRRRSSRMSAWRVAYAPAPKRQQESRSDLVSVRDAIVVREREKATFVSCIRRRAFYKCPNLSASGTGIVCCLRREHCKQGASGARLTGGLWLGA